jgi:hypothetical protein
MTENNKSEDKKANEDMLAKIKKQNPGVKIVKNKDGGFQISNPRAPNSLLMNLLKRVTK